jgi:hypothetical protein
MSSNESRMNNLTLRRSHEAVFHIVARVGAGPTVLALPQKRRSISYLASCSAVTLPLAKTLALISSLLSKE